jgi:glucose/arabinose dehydrogenase
MKTPVRFSSLALLALATIVSGQQKVPFQNGIPVAPDGLAHRALPKLPMEFDTGEGQRIRVVAVARGLEAPFSAVFLPDGSMLVTTRTGQLRIIRKGVLDPKPIAGTPASYWAVESGLPGAVHGYMDIALHPQFAQTDSCISPIPSRSTRNGGSLHWPAGSGMAMRSPG